MLPSSFCRASRTGVLFAHRQSVGAIVASVPGLIDRGIARLAGSIIVRQGALVFAATMVLNLGGFAFHAIASRRIGVNDYGVLYTLISMSTILAIPASLAAPVIARFAAEFGVLHDERHVRRLIVDLVRSFGLLGVGYLVVSLAFMRPAAQFLHAPIWPAPLVALIAGALLLSGVLRAVAQGTQDFAGFARSCLADGFSKFVGVVAFTAIGLGLLGGNSRLFLRRGGRRRGDRDDPGGAISRDGRLHDPLRLAANCGERFGFGRNHALGGFDRLRRRDSD